MLPILIALNLAFLKMKTIYKNLTPMIVNDANFHNTWLTLTKTLSCLDEPDIFDINKGQKHILNQLIHFSAKNWDGHENGKQTNAVFLQKRIDTTLCQ